MKLERFYDTVQKGILVFDGDECTKGFSVKVPPFDQSIDTIKVELEGEVGNSWTGREGCRARLSFGQKSLPVCIVDVLDFPVVQLKKLHSRNYVRVDVYLPVLLKKLSPENLACAKDIYLKPHWSDSSNSIIDDLLNKDMNTYKQAEADFPKLFHMLAEINVKLNVILSFLSCDEGKELIISKPRKINISGSGMAFWTDQPYEPGDHVGVRMVLPLFYMAFIGCIAEVVSVSRSDNPRHDENIYRVSMKFCEISEDSKEKIIQYVFQRQREILRQRSE